jgi:hypothetical protein
MIVLPLLCKSSYVLDTVPKNLPYIPSYFSSSSSSSSSVAIFYEKASSESGRGEKDGFQHFKIYHPG